jgi:argonaute-like protein implicated in RNA metabolism and viral defense
LIRRFRGQDTIETIVKEILALTKMNWNGGELYRRLPVTLDFSKILSSMSKQMESLKDIPYDFRFFM